MSIGKEMLNKKRVLGRGIGALIGETEAVPQQRASKERFLLCPIGDITPNMYQPRKTFNDASIKELADSIKEKGIIEPLIVRRNPIHGFELIAGERRLRAAKAAGLKEVPVVVSDATDEESLEFAIIENIQREDLNALEEAEAYKSLMNFGLSQEEVAKRVGKERATVANYLRLLKLPHEIKEELAKGTISMGHARAILSLDGHGHQTELCRKILTKGLSVREAERLASTALKTKKTDKKQARSSGGLQIEIEEELRTILGTKVVVHDKNGKGRIELNYFSADERERLIDLLRLIKTR
jgi:ParB family chromosome partitioning protein